MDGVPERSTVRESGVGGDRGSGPVRFRPGRAVRAAKAFHQADHQRAVHSGFREGGTKSNFVFANFLGS